MPARELVMTQNRHDVISPVSRAQPRGSESVQMEHLPGNTFVAPGGRVFCSWTSCRAVRSQREVAETRRLPLWNPERERARTFKCVPFCSDLRRQRGYAPTGP